MKGQQGKNAMIHFGIILLLFGLITVLHKPSHSQASIPPDVLNYQGNPSTVEDRSSLSFSDQGAWFAYGFLHETHKTLGFSGPFLMTQGQGEWCSRSLSELELINKETKEKIDLSTFSLSQTSFNSHLNQVFKNQDLLIKQNLFFSSPHSTIITSQITNQSNEVISFQPEWTGSLFQTGLQITNEEDAIYLNTDRSNAQGIVQVLNEDVINTNITNSSYSFSLEDVVLNQGETATLTIAHTFIFPEYDVSKEQSALESAVINPQKQLQKRIEEKSRQLNTLYSKLDSNWQDSTYRNLVAKTVLTLQNNTRIPSGELKHTGLFPSYHFKWFLGFWAWDSWKHAVALSHYNSELAKDQIRAMYDFQQENGFIADCVFRDTSLENHNYRNTKPPLSAWAVWNIYKQDGDINFINEMYPKIVAQHNWWYEFRDYDQDGICEYGSTDGTLVAAKWESGMDNAVRFDKSEMLKTSNTAYSLNQESVDLNAYLYAEKIWLVKMANVINRIDDARAYNKQAAVLKAKIQHQFFDEKTGWFYDTSIDGENLIDVMGCEGWIPLWANVATDDQAEAVKKNMMNPDLFNTTVPFQTLSASHPDFNPDRGYWRGPNWLDQAYFGVKGLHNYGYHEEAYMATFKLIHNAEGVTDKGSSIRENYQPMTGAGLKAQNFSWSAAHYLLLILNQ